METRHLVLCVDLVGSVGELIDSAEKYVPPGISEKNSCDTGSKPLRLPCGSVITISAFPVRWKKTTLLPYNFGGLSRALVFLLWKQYGQIKVSNFHQWSIKGIN